MPDDPVCQRAQLDRIRRTIVAPHPKHQDLPHDRRNGSQRRADAGRHAILNQLQPFHDDLTVRVDVRPPVELDIDDRDPDSRGTADRLNAVGSVDGGFDGERHESFDLFGSQARRFGHDDHTRTVQIREDVNRGVQCLPSAIPQQEDGECDDQ